MKRLLIALVLATPAYAGAPETSLRPPCKPVLIEGTNAYQKGNCRAVHINNDDTTRLRDGSVRGGDSDGGRRGGDSPKNGSPTDGGGAPDDHSGGSGDDSGSHDQSVGKPTPGTKESVGNPGNDKSVGKAGENPNGKGGWGSGKKGKSE